MKEAPSLVSPVKRLITRARRILGDRVIKKWGPVSTKQALWDAEFSSGQWDHLDHTHHDAIYQYLERYANQGAVLDLGCGASNTGNELNPSAYVAYTGVDLSAKALEKAVSRTIANDRDGKNHYVCADIASYVPRRHYDVILFRESIFYLPLSQIRPVLERYASALTQHGVFIVRIWDRRKYRAIVRLIDNSYRVVERGLPDHTSIILVFR
jgi:SAM-dependent methyltransferase